MFHYKFSSTLRSIYAGLQLILIKKSLAHLNLHAYSIKGDSMRSTTYFSTMILCSVLTLGACSTRSPTKQEIGTATGAVVGGIVGSSVTGGSTVGTVGGAAGGALIGNQIGKQLDKVK